MSRWAGVLLLLAACGSAEEATDASMGRPDASTDASRDEGGMLVLAGLSAVAESDMRAGTVLATLGASLPETATLEVSGGNEAMLFELRGRDLIVGDRVLPDERRGFTLDVTARDGLREARATAMVQLFPAHGPAQDARIGAQSLIWLRANFTSAAHRDSPGFVDAVRTSINRYVRAQSYGQAWFEPFEIAPVLEADFANTEVPRGNPAAPNFLEERIGRLARDAGLDIDAFAYKVYSFPAGGLDIGGGALGRSYAAWIPDQTWTPGTVHEMIHTLGVGHAEVRLGTASFPGSRIVAGIDPYFFMGSERSPSKEELADASWRIDAPLNAPMRHRIGWIRPSNVIDVEASGEFRVFDVDTDARVPGRPMMLRYIDLLGRRGFMVSYTPGATGEVLVTRGVTVHEIPDERGFPTLLLDGRPDSIPEEELAEDPARSQLLNQLAECHDAALETGDAMDVTGLLRVEVLREGDLGGARFADVRIDLD
ncbi:MAG: hypothetical protein AAF447_08005 [Myxococcota bacterium]